MTEGVKTISVAGGTLFRVAAEHLNDALQWTRIARLNGLSDPWLTGIVVLKIPRRDVSSSYGGILGTE